MTNSTVTLILVVVILLILSAYFSAIEMAFSSLNRIRVKNMAENGSKRAKLVLDLYDHYDRLISTIVVGNTIVSITSASVAAVLFIDVFGDIGATISTVVITVAILIFCEITPKNLAKESPEKFALAFSPFLRVLIVILTPVNFVFAQWRKFLSFLFKTKPDDRAMTEQELLSVVEEAQHDGAIDENDKELINNAIEFNDTRAEDILTPRVDITGAPKDASIDTIRDLFLRTGYSRMVIYDESMDNIIGVIHLRDFYSLTVTGGHSIDSIISPAVFVAPAMKINDLLKLLQKEQSHMAVVTDEYGGTAGIVTMEDILEALVGEIWDESDEVIEEFTKLGEDKYRIICTADLGKMFEYFNLSGEADPDSSTVSGWIMNMLQKIPEEGDTFGYENLTVTVNKTSHRRVLECTVTVNEEKNDSAEADEDD